MEHKLKILMVGLLMSGGLSICSAPAFVALHNQEDGKWNHYLDSGGYTPLINAIKMNNIDEVKLLLKRGENPNGPDGIMDVPLIHSLSAKDIDILQELLLAGADFTKIDLPLEKKYDPVRYVYDALLDQPRINAPLHQKLVTAYQEFQEGKPGNLKQMLFGIFSGHAMSYQDVSAARVTRADLQAVFKSAHIDYLLYYLMTGKFAQTADQVIKYFLDVRSLIFDTP